MSVQTADGSWSGGQRGNTGLACTKLMDYATDPERGLGLPSPFDDLNPYKDNVERCVAWILDRSLSTPIGVQNAGDPDSNGNGIGVRTSNLMYENGISLMTLCNTVEFDRIVGSGPQAGRTYLDVAQDMMDYLSFCQSEGSSTAAARGSWDYTCNSQGRADQSASGWVGFGLGFAVGGAPEGCGLDVPQFVKDELALYAAANQAANGCANYTIPVFPWHNVLKQGHLLQILAFTGNASDSAAVQAALDCLCQRYDAPDDGFSSNESGWTGAPGQNANYQATYNMAKGLLAFGDDLKFICDPEKDWCADFDAEIVAEQLPDGSWGGCPWWDGTRVRCTSWALLTLERAVPPPPGEFTKELTSGPDNDMDGEVDLVVEVNTLTPETYDFTITYTLPDNPPVLIEDTVPAEWDVQLADDTLGCVAESASGRPGHSATKIDCGEPNDGSLVVFATTRCHDHRNNQFCRPTSCGGLWLNDGALAYEVDEFGDPLVDEFGNRLPPIETTEGICLGAVFDVNGDGVIDWTGSGDEDGDGFSDYEEACGACPTDPCVFTPDTDGDGVPDECDACPADPNPDCVP